MPIDTLAQKYTTLLDSEQLKKETQTKINTPNILHIRHILKQLKQKLTDTNLIVSRADKGISIATTETYIS
jgi:hypothetical protein